MGQILTFFVNTRGGKIFNFYSSCRASCPKVLIWIEIEQIRPGWLTNLLSIATVVIFEKIQDNGYNMTIVPKSLDMWGSIPTLLQLHNRNDWVWANGYITMYGIFPCFLPHLLRLQVDIKRLWGIGYITTLCCIFSSSIIEDLVEVKTAYGWPQEWVIW